MTAKRWVALGVLGAAFAASAETDRVRIAPLPLKTATGDPKLDEDLPRRFEVRLLASKQVDAPLPEKVREYLRTRSGAPCDKDSACLKTLAENTSSLYSLAAAMKLNGPGTAFEVSATLFRVDGEKTEIAFEYKFDRQSMMLAAAGDEAIKELISRLELEKLPRVLPLKSEPVAVPQPPPFNRSMRRAGYLIGAGSVAMGITSTILAVIAKVQADSLVSPMGMPNVLADAKDTNLTYMSRTIASTAAGVAICAAAIGGVAVLLYMSAGTEPEAVVAPVVTSSGAGVSLSWRLP